MKKIELIVSFKGDKIPLGYFIVKIDKCDEYKIDVVIIQKCCQDKGIGYF